MPEAPARSWPGVLALIAGVVGVLTFTAFLSTTGHVPKSLAYSSNLLFAVYTQAPLISGFAGAAAVLFAAIALRRASQALGAAIVGVGLGIAIFVVVMASAASLSSPSTGDAIDAAGFPSLRATPPVIGLAAALVGTAFFLFRARNVSGYRPAIAAAVMGAVVAFYWVMDLVIFNALSQ